MSGSIPPLINVKRQLRELLDGYFDEAMSGKLVRLVQLRAYASRQDPIILIDEIRSIDNEQELNVLLGVGMKGILYYEVIRQKAKAVGL